MSRSPTLQHQIGPVKRARAEGPRAQRRKREPGGSRAQRPQARAERLARAASRRRAKTDSPSKAHRLPQRLHPGVRWRKRKRSRAKTDSPGKAHRPPQRLHPGVRWRKRRKRRPSPPTAFRADDTEVGARSEAQARAVRPGRAASRSASGGERSLAVDVNASLKTSARCAPAPLRLHPGVRLEKQQSADVNAFLVHLPVATPCGLEELGDDRTRAQGLARAEMLDRGQVAGDRFEDHRHLLRHLSEL